MSRFGEIRQDRDIKMIKNSNKIKHHTDSIATELGMKYKEIQALKRAIKKKYNVEFECADWTDEEREQRLKKTFYILLKSRKKADEEE